MSAYPLLLNAGEVSVTAGTASLLVSMGPIFVAVLAAAFLGERITRRAACGIAVAFAGALIIALGQGGGVSGVVGRARRACRGVEPGGVLRRAEAFARSLHRVRGHRLRDVGGHAAVGVGASAGGFIAWACALARLPVSTASSALYSVPAVAILVALVWLGELPSVASVLGGAVALGGVVLATRSAHAEGDRARARRRRDLERVAARRERPAARGVDGQRPRGEAGGL